VAPPFRNLPRSRNTFSLLRYLFPNTHQRARDRLLNLRLETFPRLRLRAQSGIYRAIVRRQQRKKVNRVARREIAEYLRRRFAETRLGSLLVRRTVRSRILRALYGQSQSQHGGVYPGRGVKRPASKASINEMTSYGGPRAPGARREKVKGYLRAANELRQTYQAQISQKLQESYNDGGVPGDWPDAEIVRSGNEEMLLFPSYARKHTVRKAGPGEAARYQPGTHESVETPHSSGDADYWKREWEKYEDANAIVDVDVRGWIYSPQSGPLNRKNRLLVAVARRLSGVYAPTPSSAPSQMSSSAASSRFSSDDIPSRHEDELAAKEAENIARHGQREADAAVRGNYSSTTSRGGTPAGSRSSSPTRSLAPSIDNEGEGPSLSSVAKRRSWNEPANMSREELMAANELLMTRLAPFMTLPTAQVPITVFFFNKEKSTSKSVTTDDSGHFNLRAALDFVPDQVRVLASEKLSAVEDVIITDHKGVSLISDIDDTIKHSAIGSGAREIFKNTFIRELSDLTIQGVKEWYSTLANMGVKLHYVSNSPWQLYPLLKSYFSMAGLPPGSFHLKQYSGMLQGIFEPAAEKKRGSLDRIMHDFPERKFILVGDSGEADLEVYTDVVLEYPDRILGVFIRDVTTPAKKAFFDQTMPISDPEPGNARRGRDAQPSPDQEADVPANRPALPARPKSMATSRPAEADLIDFGDDTQQPDSVPTSSHADDLRKIDTNGKPHAPPAKPNKPSSLRNFSTSTVQSTSQDRTPAASDTEAPDPVRKKAPPPPAPRRSTRTSDKTVDPASFRPPFSSPRQHQDRASPPPLSRTATAKSTSTTSSRAEEGYVATARRQISTAYNALPALRAQSPQRSYTGSAEEPAQTSSTAPTIRRNLSSYPAAAARWATGADTYNLPGGGTGTLGAASAAADLAPYDRKVEIWRRRWARAEELLGQRGVVLRSWCVGDDVKDECVRLVREEMRRQGR
jgi:phosphatidate phosphatase APP1